MEFEGSFMYRLEHPNPQFERKTFTNLNGEWEFELGKRKDLINTPLASQIQVPFCVESKLSGVENTDFVPDCIYSKMITVTENDLTGRHIFIVPDRYTLSVERDICEILYPDGAFNVDVCSFTRLAQKALGRK